MVPVRVLFRPGFYGTPRRFQRVLAGLNMSIPNKVVQVLQEIGETAQTSTWDCHGTTVVLHKALERVAAHRGIMFDAPQIIESDVIEKSCVICVTGHLKDRSEWSFGEAAPYNNKNSFPFAMAEKRAKDRVILKLVGLHGYVYSEDEADDFKNAKPSEMKGVQEAKQKSEWRGPLKVTKLKEKLKELSKELDAVTDQSSLEGLLYSSECQDVLAQASYDLPAWYTRKDDDGDGAKEKVFNTAEAVRFNKLDLLELFNRIENKGTANGEL